MAECKVTLHGAKRHGDGVHCELSVHPAPKEGTSIKYIASAPAERRSSFTGSCLPFANERQAFANTPNVGEVRGSPQPASIHLPGAPNSYYAGLGTLLIPPHVRVEYLDQSGNLRRGSASLANVVGVPFRTNTYQRMRTGAEFYDVPDVLARSQPQILQASAFPASAAAAAAVAADLGDFWRGKPPC